MAELRPNTRWLFEEHGDRLPRFDVLRSRFVSLSTFGMDPSCDRQADIPQTSWTAVPMNVAADDDGLTRTSRK